MVQLVDRSALWWYKTPQKRDKEIKKAEFELTPITLNQVIGVFYVLETLNNYMLEPLEAAMTGVFTLGFLTAYVLMFFYKVAVKIAKYFKGIKK